MTQPYHVVIRPRRDDDLDQLARILLEVHEKDGYPVEGVADPHAWLHLEQPLGAWVAELNGQVVGHVALTEPGPHDSGPRMWAQRTGGSAEETAVLGRLFLAPAARGRSLGAELTKTASEEASRIGRTAVLDVMQKDAAAIHTYERLGWARLAEIEHAHGVGHSEPALVYALPRNGANSDPNPRSPA